MVDKKSQAAQGPPVPDGAEPDAEIRDKVRDLTSQVLKGGHLDPEEVKEVVQAMTPGSTAGMEPQAADVRRGLAEAVQGLDEALMRAAEAAHVALQQLGSKGIGFTDNDLKETFAMLKQLQGAYVATANRVAEAASGNIQRELRELAVHAQQVGVDASARVAAVMTEFASRLTSVSREGASAGFDAARDYGVRMTLLASGVLAGIADALREQSGPGTSK